MKRTFFWFLVFVLTAFCVGCSPGGEKSGQAEDQETPTITPMPSATSIPTATFTPQPTLTPSATPIVILDPDPIEVSFSTSDGVELTGMYYPASENPAPVIVLVHWAEGDQSEWLRIAQWLQNRDQLVREPDYNHSWLSSEWFPFNPHQEPLGVFTFTLRGCENQCQAYQPVEWLLDIEAAMKTAAHLQGVDRQQILTAGASIGADGALYGCSWLNRTGEGSCPGSFSLSPGSLLTIPYQDLVLDLAADDPPGMVYCLYGLRDDASLETCDQQEGITAVNYGYIENHGLRLLQPGQGQDPLLLLIEFIQRSLGSD